MRTVRSHLSRLAVMLAAVCAAAVAWPGTASAGGPTSVLLASPYTGSVAALYYADDDYSRLSELLGGPDLLADAAPAAPAAPAPVAGSPYVTATWLIHDVSVWRIDRIFPVGDDVWIVTETSTGDGTLTGDGMYPNQTGNAAAVWHRAADPIALTALLTDHGLTPGAPRPAAGSMSAPETAAPVPAASAAPTPAAPPSVWLWGIGGLLAGLVIGGALVRAATIRRTPTGSPAEPARMLPIT